MAGAYGGAGLRGGGHMGLPGPLRDLAIKPPEPLRPDPLSLGWLTWGPTSQDPLAASYAFGLHFTMVLGAGWAPELLLWNSKSP